MEHIGQVDVQNQDSGGHYAHHDGRGSRRLRPACHVRESVRKWQVVVAGHREHEPNTSGMNGKCTYKYSEHDAEEQENTQPRSEHVLD
jgi:hypothetical protein